VAKKRLWKMTLDKRLNRETRLRLMMIGSEIDDVVFVSMLEELGRARGRSRVLLRKWGGIWLMYSQFLAHCWRW
jgi:hypothetical protein